MKKLLATVGVAFGLAFLSSSAMADDRSAAVPKATYEVLYWIGASGSQYSGTSFWIRFNEDAGLHSFSINQSVENDYARLWLDVIPKR